MKIGKKKSWILLYILGVLVLATGIVSARMLPAGVTVEEEFVPGIGQPVGSVVLSQGDVYVIHKDEQRAFKTIADLPLYRDDTVISEQNSRVRLQLNDESVLTLASNTRMVIDESIYDTGKRQRSSFIRMVVGKIRFGVKKLLDFKNSDFTVKTKTAVCGVRGSDFIVESSERTTRVTALENTVLEITSLTPPCPTCRLEPVLLNDFQRTSIDFGEQPTPIETLRMDEIEELKRDFILRERMITTESQKAKVMAAREKVRTAPGDLVRPDDSEDILRRADELEVRRNELEDRMYGARSIEEQPEELTDDEVNRGLNERWRPLPPFPEMPE